MEPYHEGSERLAELLTEGRQLYADEDAGENDLSVEPLMALARIEELVDEWKRKAAEPEIAMARKVAERRIDSDHLQKVLGEGTGKDILDEMRDVAEGMKSVFEKDGNLEGVLLAETVIKAMIDQETGERGFLITGEDSFLAPYISGKDLLDQSILQLRTLVATAHDPKGAEDGLNDLENSAKSWLNDSIDRLEKLAGDWVTLAAEPEIAARRTMDAHPKSLKDVAALLEAKTGKDLMDALRMEFAKLIEIEEGNAAEAYSLATTTATLARNIGVSLIVIALSLGSVIAVVIGRAISIPLLRLTGGAEKIARGDLATRVQIHTPDEFGALAGSFDHMAAVVDERTSALEAEIVERKRAEERVNSAVDRLSVSHEELARLNIELERSNEELDTFAQVASHDLQEPLRKIQTFGDRLGAMYHNELGERGQDYLARMQGAAGRMQDLIRDLLSYSRVTTNAKQFETVDLAKIAQEVVSDLETRIRATDGRVEIGELPVIEADALQMHQLFQNLIGNALKYHKPEEAPRVTVREETDGSAPNEVCRVYVEDNGIGFDEKYNERIFGMFERLHGRDSYEGTGVGLAVCHRIVDRHRGRITAQGTPGEGAVFVVQLPRSH